jgi:hypothetical protein
MPGIKPGMTIEKPAHGLRMQCQNGRRWEPPAVLFFLHTSAPVGVIKDFLTVAPQTEAAGLRMRFESQGILPMGQAFTYDTAPVTPVPTPEDMAARIMTFAPATDAEALKLLRTRFPESTLSMRVAALDFLLRRRRRASRPL